MDVFQMTPRCLEHDTALEPRTRNGRVGRPLWALYDEATSAYTYDLYQMFCPLDSQGGNTCCEAWRMVELSFTMLPHGLLRPPERRYHHVIRPLGEGSDDSSPGTVGTVEGTVEVGRSSNGHQPLDSGTSTAVLEGPEGGGTVVLDPGDGEGDRV